MSSELGLTYLEHSSLQTDMTFPADHLPNAFDNIGLHKTAEYAERRRPAP